LADMVNQLEQIISHGGLTKSEKVLALVHPSLVFSVPDIILRNPCAAIRRQYTIPAYNGKNANVLATRSYFEKHLANELHAAFVHGSLATDDEISYSDFDGLLVLKNETCADKRRLKQTLLKLTMSLRFLRKQDALQHHGWMILTQSDLLNYQSGFLPVETLEKAQSILGKDSVTIELASTERAGSARAVSAMIESISGKLNNSKLYQSAYFLKVLLSELMLLPALLYSLKHEKGIYKRESFAAMKDHFDPAEWLAIDKASSIREVWPSYKAGFIGVINDINPVLASWLAKRKRWSVPEKIAREVDSDFVAATKLFLAKCQKLTNQQ